MPSKPKAKTVQRRSIAFPMKQLEQLEKLAAKENQDVSKIVRRAVDEYMNIQANKDDINFITNIIRQEVKAEMGKQANRLAAMFFKVGAIASSNYFLAVKMLSDVINPSLQEDFKDINSNARRLGIDYMKQNGVGVVEFLEDDDAVDSAVGKVKANLFG
ncbi:MAG: ribbon-helix-helix domain-containing protein [Defluviitaleaceae bacterium]|nr:ribbon-helix-helix domain-containing protein [Defluviitaleaceae bacterium]